jgi:hypothetical protein
MDDKCVGAAFAFPATTGGLHLHSHMTAVLEEYRDQGAGYALKIDQWQWAKKNNCGVQEVYSTGLSVFLVSAIIIFIFSIIFILSIPLGSWLNLKIINNSELNVIILLMIFKILISLPVGLMQGIYRAIGLQGTSVMYSNLMILVQFLASIYALLHGASMIWLS